MGDEILTKMSEEQKRKNDVDVDLRGARTYRQRWLRRLAAAQTEATRDGVPFDYRSAKIDFEEAQRLEWRKNQRKHLQQGVNNEDDVPIVMDDFKKYRDPKRFLTIKEEPIFESKLQDGMKVQVETGYYTTYQSKERGDKISVQHLFTPEELEARKNPGKK